MKTIILALVALACFLSAQGIQWIGYNAAGNEVRRVIRVLASPDQGNPHTYTILATQQDIATNAKGKNVSKVKDAIEFSFSTVGLPHLTLKHYASATDTVETRAGRHVLRKLLEYVNQDADPGYQPEDDLNVQNYYFWNHTWTPLAVTTQTVGGATVTSICTNTENSVVIICAYLTDIAASLTVNGSAFALDNQAIHHTLTINNFPFRVNNSRLAAKAHFEAKTRVVQYNSTGLDEAALDLSDAEDDHHPIAAWSTFINVTGAGCTPTAPVQREIIRTVESSNDVDVMPASALQFPEQISFATIIRITYFSFLTNCQPTQIFWDPDFGLVDDSASTSSSVVVVPSSLLVAFFIFFNLF